MVAADIICPDCELGIDLWDEKVFVDDLCSDAGTTEIECPYCGTDIPVITHCKYRFEIDDER